MMRKSKFSTKNMILCALFAALTAMGAFIRVPIPVVPFTLQFLFTNLAGLLLGSKLGAIAVGVYVFTGLAGLPIFTGGGGIGYVLQPTFGYIIGFVAGAWLTGHFAEKQETPTIRGLLGAGFGGLTIVYLLGMIYYYFIANYYLASPIGVRSLILYCFILAVPGDIVICFVSATLAKRLIPLMKRGQL